MRCPGDEILRVFARATIDGPKGPVASHITSCPSCLERMSVQPDATSFVQREISAGLARLAAGTEPPPVGGALAVGLPAGTAPARAVVDPEAPRAKSPTSAHAAFVKSAAHAKSATEAPEPAAPEPATSAATSATSTPPAARSKRRVWPWVVATGATAALVGAAIFVQMRRNRAVTNGGATCAASPQDLAGTWDATRRAEIERAFTATGSPSAASAFKAVTARLDEHTRQWTAHRGDTCEVARVACYDASLARVRALTDALRAADAATVEHAVVLVAGVVPLAACDNVPAKAPSAPAATIATTEAALIHAALAPDREHAAALYRDALAAARAATDEHAVAAALIGVARATGGDAELTEAEALVMRLEPNGALEGELRDAQGEVLAAKGDAAKARDALTRAVAIREQVFGPHSALVAASLGRLAGVERDLGGYSRALELEQRRAAIVEQTLGADHPELAAALDGVADTLEALGRYDEARAPARRALDITERVRGKRAPDTGEALVHLARVEQLAGNYDEAKQLLVRARSVFERDATRLARVLAVQAQLAFAEGDYQAASDLETRAFSLEGHSLPAEHLQRARSMHVTGTIALMTGALDAARTNLEGALAMREKLGAPPADLVTSLAWLARLEDRAGNRDAARGYATRATELAAKALTDAKHATTAALADEVAGKLAADAGDLDAARAAYGRVLAGVEQAFGTNAHPRAGLALVGLAEVEVRARDFAKAESLFDQALTALAKAPAGGLRGQRRADAGLALAQLLWERPDQRTRAREVADAARETYAAGGAASAKALAAAQRWLTSHTID